MKIWGFVYFFFIFFFSCFVFSFVFFLLIFFYFYFILFIPDFFNTLRLFLDFTRTLALTHFNSSGTLQEHTRFLRQFARTLTLLRNVFFYFFHFFEVFRKSERNEGYS